MLGGKNQRGLMRLRAEGLIVFRSERLVLDGLSFGVLAGGALLLLGPNGSGKSTLLRVLAGLKRPDGGRLSWDDADVVKEPALHGADVGYLGHLDAIKPSLSVRQNLMLAAMLSGKSVLPSLEMLGLSALVDLPAKMLSAGQRRRLALARLHLGAAPLWLLDEPSLGLDAMSVDRLGELIARHRAGGGVVVVATHVPVPLPDAQTLDLT